MKFAVFILSHERAERVETYSTLKNAGYTGKIYVVVDDEDTQLETYRNRFTDDLIIFCKQNYIENTDTLETAKLRASAVYARNAIEDLAVALGLDAFGMFDDDILKLRYKYHVGNNKFRCQLIKYTLDEVLNSFAEFLVSDNIATLSFVSTMFHMGGLSDEKVSNERCTYQIHIRNANKPVDWKAVMNEDIITEIFTATTQGYIWWSLPFISHDAAMMNKLSGGVKSVYDSMSEYKRAFLATIVNPSSCYPYCPREKIRIHQNKKASWPMIISSRYRK